MNVGAGYAMHPQHAPLVCTRPWSTGSGMLPVVVVKWPWSMASCRRCVLDHPNGNGTFPSRDKRLVRAKRIVALRDIKVDITLSTLDVDGFPLTMGTFKCKSQNPLSNEVYEGTFGLNDGPVDDDGLCDCKDWAKGFGCKHWLASMLEAGASEASLAL